MKEDDYIVNNVSLANVRNLYERMVIDLMQKLIPEFPEFDNCRICIEDVYALSMSRIPATYVHTDSFERQSTDEDDSVREIVRYAIYHVIGQPKHG
jgi:hypothetical protein